jgi:tRNA(Ile2) C34 agmatinyltransferase TiaS
MALKCVEACRMDGVEFLNMRLVQLNPAVPNKTTNCVSSALNFAVRPGKIPTLLEAVRLFVEKNTFSKDTGIAFCRGIENFTDAPVARQIKTEIMTREQAEKAAEDLGIEFLDTFNGKGRIGALGAVVWGNRGTEAAGLYGEHL